MDPSERLETEVVQRRDLGEYREITSGLFLQGSPRNPIGRWKGLNKR